MKHMLLSHTWTTSQINNGPHQLGAMSRTLRVGSETYRYWSAHCARVVKILLWRQHMNAQAQKILALCIDITTRQQAEAFCYFDANSLRLSVRVYPLHGHGVELIPSADICLAADAAQASLDRLIGQLEAIQTEQVAA